MNEQTIDDVQLGLTALEVFGLTGAAEMLTIVRDVLIRLGTAGQATAEESLGVGSAVGPALAMA